MKSIYNDTFKTCLKSWNVWFPAHNTSEYIKTNVSRCFWVDWWGPRLQEHCIWWHVVSKRLDSTCNNKGIETATFFIPSRILTKLIIQNNIAICDHTTRPSESPESGEYLGGFPGSTPPWNESITAIKAYKYIIICPKSMENSPNSKTPTFFSANAPVLNFFIRLWNTVYLLRSKLSG